MCSPYHGAKRPRRDVAEDKAKHGTYFALVYHCLSSVVAQSLPAEYAKPLDSKPPRLETSTHCTCLRWAYSALVGDLVQELFRTYAAGRGNSAGLSAHVQLALGMKRPSTPGVSYPVSMVPRPDTPGRRNLCMESLLT
jgi:hypothetical protein